MPVAPDVIGDAALISSVRAGDQSAVATLWQRHHRAAVLHAHGLVGASDAEDVVSEAFTSVIGAIVRGKGPEELFRPYLYTVIRNLAGAEFRRRALHADSEVDFDTFEDDAVDAAAQMAHAADRSTLGRAFRSLPERWQSVLWYLDVEQMRPRHIAPLVDLKPGAVSSLAYRARQALRAAWVQEHLALESLSEECRRHLAGFGAYEAGTLAARDRRRLEEHIRGCPNCPPVVEDARRLAARIAAAVLPTVGGLAAARAASTAPPTSAASAAPARRLTGPRRVGAVVAIVAGGTAVAVAIAVAVTAPVVDGEQASPATSHAPATPATPATPAPPAAPQTVPVVPPHTTLPRITPPTPGGPVVTAVELTTTEQPRSDVQETAATPLIPKPTPVPVPEPPVESPPAGTPTTPVTPTPRSASPVPTSSSLLVADLVVDVSGSASPDSRIVLQTSDGTVDTTTDAAGRWSARLQFAADGVHRVTVTATAPGHTVSAPATMWITVDTTAPAAPTIATTWSDTDTAAPEFAGTAEPGSTIAISATGQSLAAETVTGADGTWRATLPGLLPTASGVHATATDTAGNTSASTASTPFAFVPTITDPNDGDIVPWGPIPVTIRGWAGSTVAVSVDGTLIGTVTIGSDQRFSGHIRTGVQGGLPPGTHALTVAYTDGASTTVTITVVG